MPRHEKISRRGLIKGAAGAAGAGMLLGSGLWVPKLAAAPVQGSTPARFGVRRGTPPAARPAAGEPTPIPSEFFFPGPPDSSDPAVGHDPSVINNFNGFVGQAALSLAGTGTDGDGNTGDYMFDADLRFMTGEFVDSVGRLNHGAFAFI
jgi:hypothetical protein